MHSIPHTFFIVGTVVAAILAVSAVAFALAAAMVVSNLQHAADLLFGVKKRGVLINTWN